MKLKTLLQTLLLITSLSTLADGFNDNYVQLDYTSNDYKHDDNTRILSGSKELDNGLLLLGSYSYMTADWNDPGEYEEQTVKTISVGIGKVINLTPKTDFISSLIYSNYDSKQICTKTGYYIYLIGGCILDNDILKTYYYTVNLGIRYLVSPDFQVNAEYSFDRKGGLNPKTNTLTIGLMKEVTKDIAVGASISSYKKPDSDESQIYIRRSF
jgi:hypothetical protein